MNTDLEEYIGSNFNDVKRALDNTSITDIKKVIEILKEVYSSNKTIYICGNGGSAATAIHMANDLSKGTVYGQETKKRFRAIDLCSLSTWSAWCNDNGYENGFKEQLKNLIKEGDVLVGISGSGNSKNVLNAVEYANGVNAKTIGLTGMGGGKLKDICTARIVVPSNSMTVSETVHMALDHLFCEYLRKWIKDGCK